MCKNQRQDLQRQLSDLIPIVELCLPIVEDTNKTNIKLISLLNELEKIKKQAKNLQTKASLEDIEKSTNYSTNVQLKTTEFAIDSLVDDLEEVFAYLNSQNHKLNNFLALKERFEAVQEERIDGITPERIYNLLEKRQLQQQRDRDTEPTKATRLQKFWQKIVNYKRSKKIDRTIAISTWIILAFSIISYSSLEYQNANESAIKENKEIDTSVN